MRSFHLVAIGGTPRRMIGQYWWRLERICQGNPGQNRESQQSRGRLSGIIAGVNSIQKVVTRKRRGDDDLAWKYWVTRPVTERLAMVEELRAEYHGWTNEPEPRLSRVCRIIRRA